MSSSVRPVPAMVRAVDTIQQAGEMENRSQCDNFTGENFTKFAVFEPLEKGFSAKLCVYIGGGKPKCFLHKFYQIAKVLS
jgi:hypothetical protein